MPQGKQKGNAFERSICKQLSLWFSEGKSDDWFWRSSNSGGRATGRGRKGAKTTGHYGDIAATCKEGESLLQCFTIEIKRGYNRCSIADLIDKPEGAAQQQYEKWFEQLDESIDYAHSISYLLIHKRDRRETVVVLPNITLEHDFRAAGVPVGLLSPLFHLRRPKENDWWTGTALSSFLSILKPHNVLSILRNCGRA